MRDADTYKSVAASGRGRVFRRGGRRQRPVRRSDGLTAAEIDTIRSAISKANESGLAFNRMVTIHWERAGVRPGHACAKATSAFLKVAADLIRRRGGVLAYVWIRENDRGDGSKGDHVHILCHVPDGVSLGRWQRGWIKRISGRTYRADTILTRTIGGSLKAATFNPDHYLANQEAVAEYVLKGATADAATAHSLGRWGEGGRVIGKRIGISKNLSAVNRQHPVC